MQKSESKIEANSAKGLEIAHQRKVDSFKKKIDAATKKKEAVTKRVQGAKEGFKSAKNSLEERVKYLKKSCCKDERAGKYGRKGRVSGTLAEVKRAYSSQRNAESEGKGIQGCLCQTARGNRGEAKGG